MQLWLTFWKLRHGIPSTGMGGLNGISYRDILAWIEVEEPYFQTAYDKSEFVEILLSVDKEFLQLQYEKSKANV